ncbi:DUF418 domain-containing protein [Alteraurantiacibacter aestuarii]|uniref:DUF418 domain-containing protein n=1 Tax=Alteraurantiacibacter aestuarii TaxID=650004 RepID=A0A844ZRQ9_9SPHN|nr:DUF418 domain-containing protein [Alteraurantiacibacter aestuarii]MXO88289.1 DUF418 domain-containing protein [Alteraurantiacibacter aestuarii]
MDEAARRTGARIDMVDGLRGFALLGLLLVHCVERFELYWLNPQPDIWFDTVFALFGGKSFAIFALLFGFGFATIMGNQRARGVDFTGRFAWRAILLAIIGTAHALVYRGDILQVLALMGLLLIPFDRIRSSRSLLLIAGLCFLQIPLLLRVYMAGEGAAWAQATPAFFGDTGLAVLAQGSLADVLAANAGPGMIGKWSFYWNTGRIVEIAGLFAVGMVLQRGQAFAAAQEKRTGWLAALAIAAAVWALCAYALPQLLPAPPQDGGAPMQRQAGEWALDQWRSLAATAFQVSLFVLAWQTPVRRVLQWLAGPGRMTLTLYVGQSLIAVPLLYGFGAGLWDDGSHAVMVMAGIALFAAQILFARWWYRHYRYGPLEWTWRAATLTRMDVPFRR